MALSTYQDMTLNAEKALRRGDMHLAELYLKRALVMTREQRLKVTSNPFLSVSYGLIELAEVFSTSLGPAIQAVSNTFKIFSGFFPPSQSDFTLAH